MTSTRLRGNLSSSSEFLAPVLSDLCHEPNERSNFHSGKVIGNSKAVAWSARAIGIAYTLTISSSVIFQTVSRTYLNEHLLDKTFVGQFSNRVALDSLSFKKLSHSTQNIISKDSIKAINAVFLLSRRFLAFILFNEDKGIRQEKSVYE